MLHLRAILGVGLVAVATACGTGGSEPTVIAAPPPVDTTISLRVAPSVAAGGTVQATITTYPVGTPALSSETPAVAAVASDGRVTGLTPGAATIRATYGSKSVSASFAVFDPAFVSLSVDLFHACGVTQSRDIYCWGSADGIGRIDRIETCKPHGVDVSCTTTPQRNTAALRFVNVSTHGGTCGLTEAGEAYCWGSGALGNPTDPQRVDGNVRFTMVETGGNTCGLDEAGIAYCWGIDIAGSLGAPPTGMCGNDKCSRSPVAVAGNRVYVTISVGSGHACALAPDGTAWCWGWNGFGQLGNGQISIDSPGPIYRGESAPVKVDTEVRFVAIDAGQFNTCALTASGQAYCWGLNANGQLGMGRASDPSARPVAVTGGLTFASITVGAKHVCGLTASGVAYCWGNNGTAEGDNGGALGDGTLDTHAAPTRVAGNLTFVELRTRRNATCGRVTNGRVYCWGSNLYGQLGIGSIRTTHSTTPAGVGGIP